MMRVAVPKEITPQARRVALAPDSLQLLKRTGVEVVVEAGAGEGSYISDEEYRKRGAVIESDPRKVWGEADLVLKVLRPTQNEQLGAHEVDLMRQGAALICELQPLLNLDLVQQLAERNISAFALDQVPRITRAQSMDTLSSMSTLVGYKAVLLAAARLPKMFPLMMTAAGSIAPAKVFVIGCGVAGLQAIATARRLGGVAEAFDTRAAVKEQVKSLGAKFVELDLGVKDTETKGGYAKALTAEQQTKQRELMAKHVSMSDVVILAALVQGRRAPLLVTEEMVQSMKPGSVIVDLAAELGGNCALTVPMETVERHGVAIIGYYNLPESLSVHASQMFGRNVATLAQLLINKEGKLKIDRADEIVAGCLITHGGEVVQQATQDRFKEAGRPLPAKLAEAQAEEKPAEPKAEEKAEEKPAESKAEEKAEEKLAESKAEEKPAEASSEEKAIEAKTEAIAEPQAQEKTSEPEAEAKAEVPAESQAPAKNSETKPAAEAEEKKSETPPATSSHKAPGAAVDWPVDKEAVDKAADDFAQNAGKIAKSALMKLAGASAAQPAHAAPVPAALASPAPAASPAQPSQAAPTVGEGPKVSRIVDVNNAETIDSESEREAREAAAEAVAQVKAEKKAATSSESALQDAPKNEEEGKKE
jgi:NAD(P) transhydrogenase subunit alpha